MELTVRKRSSDFITASAPTCKGTVYFPPTPKKFYNYVHLSLMEDITTLQHMFAG